MKSKLIIIGTGGHSGSVIDACEKQGRYEICGLIDDFRQEGNTAFGYRIIGKIKDIFTLENRENYCFFIAVGDNNARFKIYFRLHELKLNYATIIHPTAIIARDVTIEPGVVMMARSVVNTFSVIGKQAIINTCASVDHDSIIEEFASMAPVTATGGNVIVGKGSSVCIGAIVLNNIVIGNNTIIGAGSLVTENQPDNIVAYGTPCKHVRTRKEGDKYL